MDYNNFNNYELTHKDKLRIYYLVSQYYMCLGLQIENYKGILNRNNFIQEPIILYVSTPKNTICKSAMRKNNEDLCGIELAKKFKSVLSVLSENKEIKIKNTFLKNLHYTTSYIFFRNLPMNIKARCCEPTFFCCEAKSIL